MGRGRRRVEDPGGDVKDVGRQGRRGRQGRSGRQGHRGRDVKDVMDVEDVEDVEDVNVQCPGGCPEVQGWQLWNNGEIPIIMAE